MGIFDKIKDAIFGHHEKASAPAPAQPTIKPAGAGPVVASTAPSPTPMTPSASTPAPAQPTPASAPSTSAASSVAPGSAASGPVDVSAILDKAAASSGQKLDWRHSVVDLMKALGMEASLSERKELAGELDYQGDTHDSAKMNTFLHKALLKKLSENGGKVPAELLD